MAVELRTGFSHTFRLLQHPQEDFNGHVDVSLGLGEGPQIRLGVKETHVIELLQLCSARVRISQ